MQAFDTNAVAIALPDVARDFGRRALEIEIVITAYLVGAIAMLPLCAWVAERFGARRTFLAAIALFGASALACGVAPNIRFLLTARFVEGCAGALLLPVGRMIVLASVPQGEFVRALSTLALPVMLGPVLGPSLGGAIVSTGSWRFLFLAMVPIALAGFVLVLRTVPEVAAGEKVRFDLGGSMLLVLGLGAVSAGMAMLGAHDAADNVAIAPTLLIAGTVLFGLYLRWSRRVDAPLIDLSLLRIQPVAASNIAGIAFRMLVAATPFLLALRFQLDFGLSAAEAGFLLLPLAFGSLTGRSLAQHLLTWLGYRTTLLANGLLVMALVAACALPTAHTPQFLVAALLFAQGAARSVQLIVLSALGYVGIDNPHFPIASTISSISQQFAQLTGIATAALIVHALNAQSVVLPTEATRLAFPIIAATTILALPAYWRLPRDMLRPN